MSKAAKWRRHLIGLIAATCLSIVVVSSVATAQAQETGTSRLEPLQDLRPLGHTEELVETKEAVEQEPQGEPALVEPLAPAISKARMQLRRGRRKAKATFAEFARETTQPESTTTPQMRTGRGTREVQPSTPEDQPVIPQSSVMVEGDAFFDPIHEPCMEPGCAECVSLCGQGCSFFGSVEFMLWWRKSRQLPPLVSTDVIGPGAPGVVLFGAENVGGEIRPGGRATLGRWLTPCADWGVMARIYGLDNEQIRFNSAETNAATVGRPIVEVDPNDDLFNQEALLQVDGFPGFDGVAFASSDSEVYGGDFLIRKAFYQDTCARGDILFGYRTSRINEDLIVGHDFVTVMNDIVATVRGVDTFDVHNEFHGFDMGVLVEAETGCWSLELLAKVALGDMEQRVSIRGESRFQTGPIVQTFPEGLLVKPTNAGEYKRNKFAVSPEVNANVRWRINDCLQLTMGYSFLHWTGVVQPGDLVDRFVNSSQEMGGTLIGSPRPEFRFFDTSYWAHGLSFGVTARY